MNRERTRRGEAAWRFSLRALFTIRYNSQGIYLLGAATLEDMGLAVDPVDQRLIPQESLLLKNVLCVSASKPASEPRLLAHGRVSAGMHGAQAGVHGEHDAGNPAGFVAG